LPAATEVDFRVARCGFTSTRPAHQIVTGPAGADVVNVTVTTPGGTYAPGYQFSYVPVLTGISPPRDRPPAARRLQSPGPALGRHGVDSGRPRVTQFHGQPRRAPKLR